MTRYLDSEMRPFEPRSCWEELQEPVPTKWWVFAQEGPEPYEDCVNTAEEAQELLAVYMGMGVAFAVRIEELA